MSFVVKNFHWTDSLVGIVIYIIPRISGFMRIWSFMLSRSNGLPFTVSHMFYRIDTLVRILGFVLSRGSRLMDTVTLMLLGSGMMVVTAVIRVNRFFHSSIYAIVSILTVLSVSAES